MNPTLIKILSAVLFMLLLASCSSSKKTTGTTVATTSNKKSNTAKTNSTPVINSKAKYFTKPLKINRDALVEYARQYIGTRYKYGSAIPKNGLDCSGFIMVVFEYFGVKTPRVSRDYTNEGSTIKLSDAKVGDLILFTGSDNSTGIVGHIGIVTEAGAVLTFISSTSGKNIGVVEAKLSGYWKTHFVKVIRLLE